jgi:hypothetical protein
MLSSISLLTDTPAAMIAWLYRHGAPRTGEVLRRLERHGWTIEQPDRAVATQTEFLASARFADIESCDQTPVKRAAVDGAMFEELQRTYLDLDATRERLRERIAADTACG